MKLYDADYKLICNCSGSDAGECAFCERNPNRRYQLMQKERRGSINLISMLVLSVLAIGIFSAGLIIGGKIGENRVKQQVESKLINALTMDSHEIVKMSHADKTIVDGWFIAQKKGAACLEICIPQWNKNYKH